MRYLTTWAFVLCLLSAGCGERAAQDGTPVPAASSTAVTAPASSEDATQSSTNELTREFFTRISDRQLGDQVGKIELWEAGGILIHPGESTPTSATFNLAGAYRELDLLFSIAPLLEGESVAEAGTVNIEVLADGRPVHSAFVDRKSSSAKTIDVTDVQALTVRVDNGNGKAWWDWLILSIQQARQP
ncbi:MAG TPA: NPCBM/NEW2 domain-containing protein [Thermoanaerobaculia bacterium]